MLVLFPNDTLHPREVDADYRAESEACCAAGLVFAVVDHDAVVRGDMVRALRFLPVSNSGQMLVYRGWMMPVTRYAALMDGVRSRGYTPLTSAVSYGICHHLPESYAFIGPSTPQSVWIPIERALPSGQPDWTAIAATASQLGAGPCIVKDWVKSQKHAWTTACFIPSASDPRAVQGITTRFLELQGEQVTGGLVFRQFLPLSQVGVHPRSGMPLGAEIRTFWIDGAPISCTNYWAEGVPSEPPDVSQFATIGRAIPSRFFSMDLAQGEDGRWFILELGDGQVSGLPEGLAPGTIFTALASCERYLA